MRHFVHPVRLGTGVAAAAGVIYAVVEWQRRSLRATRAEVTRELPGDHIVREPIDSLTHAFTIRRPPAAVWPWLVQMGATRAGWYSYDFIDNGRQTSLDCIIPELQHIE